jgi:aspartyl-tRNA(Asn)/glutamyl-tRNA(Gln) amidotransferase subunit B
MSTVDAATSYESVIGLEVHVELSTATKMFSGCPADFGGEPNTRVDPVTLGLPGSLPVVNERAVEFAIRLGLALNCEVRPQSQFHRKNYFYPDMPKNYQISQYDVAICERGFLDLDVPGGTEDADGTHRIRIHRVHMEEDTGKTLHVGTSGRIHGADYSLVDYNRAGIPLLEIVSEPDIRSSEQAKAYLAELRAIVLALGISDAKLEEGSMRCDANISLRPRGQAVFGTRVEVKNMNSLRSLGRAIDYEIARQADLLEAGQQIVQETRHWNEDAGSTSTLRAKEEAFDYRYFPDPDLVPIAPADDWVERIRAGLPDLPAAIRTRLGDAGLEPETAALLVGSGLHRVFDQAISAGANGADAAKWLTNEVTGWANEHDAAIDDLALSGAHLAELLALVDDGTLSVKLAREALDGVLAGEGSPRDVASARGLEQVSDDAALGAMVDDAIAGQPDAAQRVRDGNDKAIGALVGAVMKASRGQANPQRVNELLRERLLG